MVVTAEISLYPLTSEYEGPIISFIKNLKKNNKIRVMTHSMSTYVKGDSKHVFAAIEQALTIIDDGGLASSLVIKIINRDLPVERGFLSFE